MTGSSRPLDAQQSPAAKLLSDILDELRTLNVQVSNHAFLDPPSFLDSDEEERVGIGGVKIPQTAVRRPKRNDAEGEFFDWIESEGWQVMKRGWPDFFCLRDGQFMAVEVKPSRSMQLKASQDVVMRALSSCGVKCFRWDPDDGLQKFKPITERKPRRKKPDSNYSAPFNAFWDAYPRREGKGRAWKYWERDGLDVLIDAIIPAIAVQKNLEQWKKDGGQFVPHPATWINDRRWEDEPMRPRDNGKPQLVADVPPLHPAHGMHAQARWTHNGKEYRLSPRWEMFTENGSGGWDFEERLKAKGERDGL